LVEDYSTGWLCDRYASLYFCCCVESNDNELLVLEVIHRYVELLDKYFGSVSISFVHSSGLQLELCSTMIMIAISLSTVVTILVGH